MSRKSKTQNQNDDFSKDISSTIYILVREEKVEGKYWPHGKIKAHDMQAEEGWSV